MRLELIYLPTKVCFFLLNYPDNFLLSCKRRQAFTATLFFIERVQDFKERSDRMGRFDGAKVKYVYAKVWRRFLFFLAITKDRLVQFHVFFNKFTSFLIES
jgi:hypothetical protein